MTNEPHHWLGMGGVPPHDDPRAYQWERRLHWVMVVVALLALPAFFLDIAPSMFLTGVGHALDLLILAAFSAEFMWMLHVTRQKTRYVLFNWLDLLIIISAAVSVAGVAGEEWIALARLVRVAYVALIIARLMGSLRNLFSPTAAPYILGWGAVTMAMAGAGFYWLEPTVHSYAEGLWLAFTSGATVGYGDIVPTTPASRLFAVFMVILGVGIMSLVTASIAAYFVGKDEQSLRREMHHDIKQLREELRQLREELRARETKTGD